MQQKYCVSLSEFRLLQENYILSPCKWARRDLCWRRGALSVAPVPDLL